MGNYAERLRAGFTLSGAKEGFCVICGKFGKLTEDHVPPKGCLRISDIVLQSITEAGSNKQQGLIIQGGVRFRTICENCNSYLLGVLYDPSLKKFVELAIQSLNQARKGNTLFPMMRATIQPNLVARALIGHLLAAHSVAETTKRIETLGANDALREFFLDPNAEFPDRWQIYCWPYLSRNQIIIRHAGIMDISLAEPQKNISYGHIVKFLPLAFWMIHEKPKLSNIRGFDITPRKNEEHNYSEKILLSLTNIPRLDYPENPGGNSVTLFSSNQASYAKIRRR